MGSPTAQLVVAVALVLLAGVFAAADAAISTVSQARTDGLVRIGRAGARQLAAVVAERRRHINLLLLLRLSCELTATVLVTVSFVHWFGELWLAVLLSAVVMVVVRVLGSVLGPLSRLLIVIGNAITPGQGFREGPFSSEVELRELVDMAQERGVVEDSEREMIHSVFELGDTVAREVMVPRTEIVWIERTKTVRQALALALRTGFTRVPVIGESVDDIVGVVNIKDLMPAFMDPDGPSTVVDAVMNPASFVPDSKRLDELLKEMQRTHNHMAIAVDEYGGTAGLLSIEDILEEIVGEITDESDTDERPEVEELEGGAVRVSSRLGIDDLGELFGIDLEEDHDVETVGGLLAERLGRVPLPGAEAEVAGLRLFAEGGKDRRGRMRITSVVVHPADSEAVTDAVQGRRRTRVPQPDDRDRSVEHA
jgi:CBS domain containing-hemolysin-like protein